MKVKNLAIWPFLFFSLCAHGSGETKKNIELPIYMKGVKNDPAQSGIRYRYVGGKIINQKITPRDKPSDSIESFVSYLWRLYKEDKKEEFKNLFTPAAKKVLEEMPEEQFIKEWESIRSKEAATLKFYFPKDEGHIVSWQAGDIPRGLYLVKKAGKYQIESFSASKDDISFHNRSHYFMHVPSKEKEAKIVRSFDLQDKKYELVLEIDLIHD
jgi:hypothetical protein